jgi:hypothetical protein
MIERIVPRYPDVPTRAALAELSLDEQENLQLMWMLRRELKGVGMCGYDDLEYFTRVPEPTARAIMRRLADKGALVVAEGDERLDVFPGVSYLGRVLLGWEQVCVYAHQEATIASEVAHWERMLDLADAAGEAVPWQRWSCE